MSFKFNWGPFPESFYAKISEIIQVGLNSGPKPPEVCDELIVKDLYFGKEPPHLQILQISELSLQKKKLLFKLSYASDGYIVLGTKVQANPLYSGGMAGAHSTSSEKILVSPDSMAQVALAADKSLVVPMVIRITDLHLDGAFWLCHSSHDSSFSFAFVSDPLLGVSVSSSFDSIPKAKKSLQEEIEKQIRDALLKAIPEAIGGPCG